MQRVAKSGLTTAGSLSLALSCAGCLVTNELDFEPNRNLPSVVRIAPPEVSWARSDADMRCLGPEEMALEADYYDDDVEQDLFVLPLLNGVPQQLRKTVPDPAGTSRREPLLICIPLSRLTQNCNTVQLLVSDDFDKITSRDPPFGDPEVASLTWFLGPTAGETSGNPARPYVSFTECFPPDGGT